METQNKEAQKLQKKLDKIKAYIMRNSYDINRTCAEDIINIINKK